jgi:putative ABC transport system permease protein
MNKNGSVDAWRWLIAGEWRAFPMRFLVAAVAIAIGVALAFAVHVINRSAADAFGAAVRTVSGDADLHVLGTSSLGFDELLYPRLMAVAEVADASPVVSLRAALGDRNAPVTLLGLDMLRALTVSPSLLGRRQDSKATGGATTRSGGADAALELDALYLSEAARIEAGLRLGQEVTVKVGSRTHVFTLVGELPGVTAGQALGMIDISAAQWRFGRLGKLDRVDLKLKEGASSQAARARIAPLLPASARLSDSVSESRRGDNLSRAYRVNLDMLALVALLTGGFLVYSAQSLSVTRRLQQFALLRTLGMQRSALSAQLLGEGLALGVLGAALGLAVGYAIAAAAMAYVGGDLGGGYFGGTSATLRFSPSAALLFFAFGVGAAIVGSYAPARAAARIAPSEALKTAGDPIDPRKPLHWRPALALLAGGAGLAFLPAVGRLPLFGYLAVALVLAGGIAAMPWLARTLLTPLARIDTRLPAVELALARVVGAPSQAAIALGGIVASTGLMIAMAVMVTSFRGSVENWLETFLSADLYAASPSNEPVFDAAAQQLVASAPGVAAVAFSKSVPVVINPELPSLLLIVRPVGPPADPLPLIAASTGDGAGVRLWLSEPAARLNDVEPGERFDLPIGPGRSAVRGHVAGIWRDYARQQGAIVIDERDYVAITGDTSRGEAAIQLATGASARSVRAAIEQRLPPNVADRLQFAEPGMLRAQALRLFDRSFVITYVLEAIAILIGLAGVAATVSAQTIARVREFGMLRHIGTTRRQIITMLAAEGALLGAIGIAAGCVLGLALSQILIHVINPQSFNWTMTTQVPWVLLLSVALALITTSAGTAMLAGRRAVSGDAVRAVREDW